MTCKYLTADYLNNWFPLFKRDKTMIRINEYYYWNGMKWDITTNYIKYCSKCFTFNSKMSKNAHPNPVPQKIWSLVGMTLLNHYRKHFRVTHILLLALTIVLNGMKLLLSPIRVQLLSSFSTICRLKCMNILIK